MYKLGAIPSPHDYRDYPVAKVIPKSGYPSEYIPKPHKIKNQASVGACVAYALSVAKEEQEFREKGFYTEYSANFIYGNRAETDYQGEGMMPREALKRLQSHGVCKEELMPGIWHYPLQQKLYTDEIYKAAEPQKVITYAAINTPDEVKNAVYSNGPVIIVIPVYSSFYKCTGEVDMPLPSEVIEGYHAMAIIGYTADRYIVQNSWGARWGKEGLCYMPFNYPISEKWAITDFTPQQDILRLTVGSNIIYKNGVATEKDATPRIINGRTYVPLRHTHEALGDEVQWIADTQEIFIIRK
jgi:hypothetical protein